MSTSISASSSLRSLGRYNYSKSTVTSSDADADSVRYASSSGTTTPEDDAQTFHLGLGPELQNVLGDKAKCSGSREKLTIVTKQRNFSLAIKKVKKVAHALAVFKRKRPDDISPILISSPLRERFGKRMSVKPQPDENFYSLPNRRFSLSDVRTRQPQIITRRFGTISGSTSNFVSATSRRRGSRLRIPSFSELQSSTLPPTTVSRMKEDDALGYSTVLVHVLRILFFVPWCAAVGGSLLLFPSHVELVAFRTGYLSSPKGLRRFAHWAECGQQHVMIFLALLVAVLCYDRTIGLSLTSIVVSRFVWVWQNFKVDRHIPLGEDDQQSLYLVVMDLAPTDASLCVSEQRERQGVAVVQGDDNDSG